MTAAHQASLFITNSQSCSNSCPSSRWCHPTISSSVVTFSSCLQSFPVSGSFQWVSSSHQVAKVLEFQLQLQSFQFTVSKNLFPMHPFSWKGPTIHQASSATRPDHCGATRVLKAVITNSPSPYVPVSTQGRRPVWVCPRFFLVLEPVKCLLSSTVS